MIAVLAPERLDGEFAEQRRADREIIGALALPVIRELRLQIVPALVGFGVDGDVTELRQEFREFLLVEIFLDELLQRLAGELAILVIAHLRAGGADDAGLVDDLSADLAVIERRQQFAFGEVAGASEDDVIEGIDGNDLSGHGVFLSGERCRRRYNLIDLKTPDRCANFIAAPYRYDRPWEDDGRIRRCLQGMTTCSRRPTQLCFEPWARNARH